MAIIDEKDFSIKKVKNAQHSLAGINELFEVIYVLRGQKKYFINNSLCSFTEGSAGLICHGDISYDRTEHNAESEYIVMTFSRSFLKELSAMTDSLGIADVFEAKKIFIPSSQRQAFETLLLTILNESEKSPDIYSSSLMRLLICEALIYLLRNIVSAPQDEDEVLTSHDGRICEVCRHICNYYNEPVSLGDMAKLAFMSPTYFSKKFKKVTGFGFNEYLNNVRAKIAINMLVQTNHSITEIAVFCGYQDSNYFGDVFRRIVGMSPSKYRKTHPKTI